MKPVKISKLAEELYRITTRETNEDSLALRYGLIELPGDGERVEAIPGISFETEWLGCREQLKELEEKYRDIQPQQIEGMPEMTHETGSGFYSGAQFFIRFPIGPEEKFYGLVDIVHFLKRYAIGAGA